ncbi:hypothetical protein X743_27105 [Mesorhizobium sp. LNHC252B00]|nr:hypothetical protein X743_27105 [Mesorhizobium sp. LNHC252B00]
MSASGSRRDLRGIVGKESGSGATTTSSLMAGKVCFQEAAKPTSTAGTPAKRLFRARAAAS